MKAWIAGSIVAWMVAAAGLGAYSWSGLSPVQRAVLRPEFEAELATAMPNPSVFGGPFFHFHVTAEWLDPDHYVRWHTLPSDIVCRALCTFFPTPLLVLAVRIAVSAALEAVLAALVLWVAIQGACGGSGGAGGTSIAPLGRNPGKR